MRKENIIIEKKKNLFWKSAWWLSLGLMIEGGFALLLDVELHGIVTYSFVLYKMYRSYQKDSSHYEFLKPTSSVKDKIRDVLTYSGWNLLYGSIATFIFYALVKAIVPNFESILDEIMDVFSTSDFPNFFIFILGIIGTGLLAPIVEEIMFRGFLYDKHTKYSRTKAMFLNALLFGLAHGGFLPVHYLAGIALYAIREKQGDIYGAIGLHMLNNILVEASFYLPTVIDIMMYGAILIYIIHLIKQGPLIFNRKDMAINEG